MWSDDNFSVANATKHISFLNNDSDTNAIDTDLEIVTIRRGHISIQRGTQIVATS